MSKHTRSRMSVPLAMGLAGVVPAGCQRGAAETTVLMARDAPRTARVEAPPQGVVVTSAPACRADALLARLRAQAVDRDHYATPTLYTWTTAEQADDLRRGGPLLVGETSPTHGASLYDAVIERLAAGGDRVAAALRQPRFQKARFAWKAPWATLLGWEGETYGDRLLRVTLRDEAWVLRVTSAAPRFEAVDLRGAPVPLAAVLAHPERVGAVHFVNDVGATQGTCQGTAAQGAGRFREYVLPNEAMVVSWELGTPEVAAALDASSELVGDMRAWMRDGCAGRTTVRRAPGDAWELPSDLDDPLVAWRRAGAFDNDRYAPTAASLGALVDALRAVPRGDPFVGSPARVTRPAPPVARTPARPVAPRGTFAGTYR